jgi:hypothetical protein
MSDALVMVMGVAIVVVTEQFFGIACHVAGKSIVSLTPNWSHTLGSHSAPALR